ncbi:MAG: hypothetical protein ACN6ON_01310 [Sphingobacterium sp.]
MKSFPAVLIGRLGVSIHFRNLENEEKSIGDQLMDFNKSWFIDHANKTGCRFIVVDSYNNILYSNITKEMDLLNFSVKMNKKKILWEFLRMLD